MEPMTYTIKTYDIVMIGGGAAGALAAIKAKRAGQSVAYITKESALVGGATIMAGAGTSVMKESDDSGDVFFDDIMASGQSINNEKLVRIIADHCTEGLFDLESCDFLLDRKDLKHQTAASLPHYNKKGEGHAFSRSYLDRREALGICHGIAKTVMRDEIDLYTETVAVRLHCAGERIAGVSAYSMTDGSYLFFSCKAVILAAGGLGGLYEETTNSVVLSGDGYALAYETGAELVDMEMVQFMPLAFPYPKIRRGKIIGQVSLLGPTVRLYNKDGERYMLKYDPARAELTTRDIGARGNYSEILEGRGTANQAILVDNCQYDPAVFERWKSTSPFRYRQCCQVFGENGGNWKEPFEAIPSQHFFMGGVKVDARLSSRVPGLYAVGEVSGGVHGANRLSGVAFPELFVLGPLAGAEAAAYARTQDTPVWRAADVQALLTALDAPLRETGDGYRPFEVRKKIQQVMSRNLGPVRNGDDLETAETALARIRADLLPCMRVQARERRYSREIVEALELPLMLQTAQMVARAAHMRTESRGAHYRSDYPDRADEWTANIVIKKGGDGRMEARVAPVETADWKGENDVCTL
jgi:fumarate reductase (CoM/CoB) subunit A